MIAVSRLLRADRSRAPESTPSSACARHKLRYGLNIPFGHDPAIGRVVAMADSQDRTAPWFWMIDPLDEVLYSDFRARRAATDRGVRRFERWSQAA